MSLSATVVVEAQQSTELIAELPPESNVLFLTIMATVRPNL